MSNCGMTFRGEVSSREFVSELKSKATHVRCSPWFAGHSSEVPLLQSNRSIRQRAKKLVKRWSEEECKEEPSLQLIPSLYADLKRDGHSFDVESDVSVGTRSLY